MNWKVWLYSLLSGGIGGAANSVGGMVVAPDVFNFSHAGLMKIGELALFGFAVPVLAFLKQSPLPPIQTTTTTVTLETKTSPAPTPIQGDKA